MGDGKMVGGSAEQIVAAGLQNDGGVPGNKVMEYGEWRLEEVIERMRK